MEENKNLEPEIEEKAEAVSEEETKETVVEEAAQPAEETVAEEPSEKPEKAKKDKKFANRPKRLKNQRLFKKGGYSIAITAIVIAAVIVLNVLVTALSERFVLEFDMTADKNNSMTDENVEYLKKLDRDVEVTVCASEDTYTAYMNTYAQQYGVNDGAASDYYDQTVRLIKMYHSYNKKIKVTFVDTQSSEFTEIASKYADKKLAYGDVIVTSTDKNGVARTRVIGYTDIYDVRSDETYAAYGYTSYTVGGNNLETALTSAIAYVTSEKEKKALFITGHSSADVTESYRELLTTNNYSITTVSDPIINQISSDYDLLVIAAPSKDFVKSEIDAISQFLDNDNKLGKGMMVFADVNAPYLENFYSFLNQWGIKIGNGILFETNERNYIPDNPTVMGSYPASDNDLTKDISTCITGNNVPLTAAFEEQDYMKVASVIATPETVVAAPKGTAETWTGAKEDDMQAYSTVLQSVKSNYDDDNNTIESFMTVFSSTEFLGNEYSEASGISNKDISLAVAEKSVGAGDTGISFISKSITNESFSDSVTASSANIIRLIFMFILPIGTLVAGIVIYFKRRNS